MRRAISSCLSGLPDPYRQTPAFPRGFADHHEACADRIRRRFLITHLADADDKDGHCRVRDAGQPAALLQALVRLPAREHSNELYAATAAAAFLNAGGRSVKVSTGQTVDLVEQTANGLDVRDIATALTTWTGSVP
ncbi:hypothetical protein GCM10010298_70530 [Streptomyces microflavus]|uniref:Uncharacterized protein n=1 Tax=Streptomyces microflavus TaxID=1919 RepID=A0A7J0D4R2_STRMI|nr:hypothetical protein Smic_82870 [Streptomyces microflavus]GGX94934.1 hypothetical protein GCM10010298_70530 [Streptomyces microflavus]